MWWRVESKLASDRRFQRVWIEASCALSESHFGTGLGAHRSHRPAVGQSVRRAMRRAEGPSTLRRLSAQSGRLRAWTAPLRRSRAQGLRAAQRAAQRDVAHSAGTHARLSTPPSDCLLWAKNLPPTREDFGMAAPAAEDHGGPAPTTTVALEIPSIGAGPREI